jgi:hypothetical protein
MSVQADMCPIAPSTDANLIGLAITMPEQCPRCGGYTTP